MIEVQPGASNLDHVCLARLGDGTIESRIGEEKQTVENEHSHEDAADLLRGPEDDAGRIVFTDATQHMVDQHNHAEKHERPVDIWDEDKQKAARDAELCLRVERDETASQGEEVLRDSPGPRALEQGHPPGCHLIGRGRPLVLMASGIDGSPMIPPVYRARRFGTQASYSAMADSS